MPLPLPREKATAMANQHHPSESGRRPHPDVLEKMPTCSGLCSWAFQVAKGLFLLKVLNPNCRLHRDLPTDPAPAPDALARWLTTAA